MNPQAVAEKWAARVSDAGDDYRRALVGREIGRASSSGRLTWEKVERLFDDYARWYTVGVFALHELEEACDRVIRYALEDWA